MVARPRMLLAIALAAASAVVLAACGSDEDVGEIPADTAAQMLAALDEAQAAQEATPPECDTIAESASTVSNAASQLPDSPVRGAVIAASENLHDLANSDQCEPSGPTGPEGPQEPTETTTAPEETTTTTEQTTTTTTTEKPPKPKPEPQPQPQPGNEGGGGLGQGDQGGQPPPETGGTGGGTGPG